MPEHGGGMVTICAIVAFLLPASEGFVATGGVSCQATLARICHAARAGTKRATSRPGAADARLTRPSSQADRSSWPRRPMTALSMTGVPLDGGGVDGGALGDSASSDGDAQEADDAPAMTRDFYSEVSEVSEVAARLNTTIEGAVQRERDQQFDRNLYDELRRRRDFGFEQDLDLELERRNISQQAAAARQGFESLEALPGVSGCTTVLPNTEQTPREVVIQVLDALKDNDRPYVNHGVEVFIRFLSPSAVMYGVEMDGVARYLAEKRNRVFMNWEAMVFPRPLTLSGGAKKNKAYQPLKVKDRTTGKWHAASVYLTLQPETQFWLIESILVKGEV